jgi:ribosomal protein L28
VHQKHFWSYALDDFVRFKVTTAAIKAIDQYGGIDNYLLNLDEKLVSDSNYVTKYRNLIAATLFHKGELPPKYAKYLGYDKVPPPQPFVMKKSAPSAAVENA